MICQKRINEKATEELDTFWANGMENNDGNHNLPTLHSPKNFFTLRESLDKIHRLRLELATRDKSFECPQALKKARQQIQRRTL